MRIAQVARCDGIRIHEISALLHKERRAVEIDKKPFMQVEVERVKGCERRTQVLVLWAHEGRARIRGVDVDPEVGELVR